ncbi:MAG: cation transporter [Desulfovibrionaceae bacterium]|nr:cation transporter [Desulfovibrionaceae bacterium]
MSPSPQRYARYSIAASLITLGLKFGAYFLTGSVGLLSDALESLINLTAGALALWALTISMRPADNDHAYGHGKAEYLAGGTEGILIIFAAAGIVYAAVQRFLHPAPLSHLGLGLLATVIASAVNLVVARTMLKAAKRFDSITLEADARHLLTDVWTSVGLVAGLSVLIVAPPGWQILDPIIACAMALNIVRTGTSLVRRSAQGLMDRALPEEDIRELTEAIKAKMGPDTAYHALRTRKSGPRRFIDFHLLVPGDMSVRQAHDLTMEIEREIKKRFPRPQITVHVEPLETEASPGDAGGEGPAEPRT